MRWFRGRAHLVPIINFPLMNPYEPTLINDAAKRSIVVRRLDTYVYAVAIGFSMSFIAPICNAAYCHLILDFPFLTTFRSLLREMMPTALFLSFLAIFISFLVPQKASRLLSRGQREIPAAIVTTLFSLYFGMLGFGQVRGGVVVFGWYLTYYVLAPAMIVAIGTLLYIIVKPKQTPATASG